MPPPLFVRELTAAGRAALRSGLQSPAAFTPRRGQVLLASAAGRKPSQIAAALGCATQAARDAIRAFTAGGVGCLTAGPSTPRTTHPAWDRTRDDDLKAAPHQSPRTSGQPTGLWTLALVAAVCHADGWTTRRLTPGGVRQALQRLGVGWKRAEHRVTSPDPDSAKKERCGTG